jgi:hypothetical protein
LRFRESPGLYGRRKQSRAPWQDWRRQDRASDFARDLNHRQFNHRQFNHRQFGQGFQRRFVYGSKNSWWRPRRAARFRPPGGRDAIGLKRRRNQRYPDGGCAKGRRKAWKPNQKEQQDSGRVHQNTGRQESRGKSRSGTGVLKHLVKTPFVRFIGEGRSCVREASTGRPAKAPHHPQDQYDTDHQTGKQRRGGGPAFDCGLRVAQKDG